MNKPHVWTDEEKEYLEQIVKGHHYTEIVLMMNKKFKYSFTFNQVRAAIKNRKLKTGFDGRFKKGNVPKNKGTKGMSKANKTSFKKGNIPHNHKPVGSERKTKDGYIMVKVAEPSKWRLKHVVNWEKVNGKLPKGHTLIFLDRNKENTSLDNLRLVSRSELLIINSNNMLKDCKELNEIAINIAKVTDKVRKKINDNKTE